METARLDPGAFSNYATNNAPHSAAVFAKNDSRQAAPYPNLAGIPFLNRTMLQVPPACLG